jgi:hypothetical protein
MARAANEGQMSWIIRAAAFVMLASAFVATAAFAQEARQLPGAGPAPAAPVPTKPRERMGVAPQRVQCASEPQCSPDEAVCTSRAVCYVSASAQRPIQGCVAYTCLVKRPRYPLDLMKKP